MLTICHLSLTDKSQLLTKSIVLSKSLNNLRTWVGYYNYLVVSQIRSIVAQFDLNNEDEGRKIEDMIEQIHH